jgi:hypothetical protein
LALARHEAIAKQNFGDQLCTEFGTCGGTLNGSFDSCTAKVMRRQACKVALKTAHGRARCADDDNGVMRCGHLKYS